MTAYETPILLSPPPLEQTLPRPFMPPKVLLTMYTGSPID